MGICPSGAIIFISQLYYGSISDKEIVVTSGLLDPQFREEGDSCIAQRGLLLQMILKPSM